MKLHYFKTKINYQNVTDKVGKIKLDVKELIYDDFLLGDKDVFNENKLELIRKRCVDIDYRAYGIVSNNLLIYSTWISLR
ncbi:MAG: hypothetical protein HGA35_06560, partial [Erysipelotrichaceae bacterium]|nr:hypothetical protein [Erysipelotrichaceae bacterium]